MNLYKITIAQGVIVLQRLSVMSLKEEHMNCDEYLYGIEVSGGGYLCRERHK